MAASLLLGVISDDALRNGTFLLQNLQHNKYDKF